MKYSPFMEKVDTAAISGALANCPETFVLGEEEHFHRQIIYVCDQAIQNHLHILLVTGPSASGKTTTAKKISLTLKALGKQVNRISLDNFYKPACELPRWEDGYQNYESVEGLDIDCFEAFMKKLLGEGFTQLPVFDFKSGMRSEKQIDISYDEHTYLIIEGIHALNPILTEPLLKHRSMKIYISVHSDFVDENGTTLLSARDLRLARRLLRDFYFRGTGVEETLKMWSYVVKGEDLYIHPFRMNADIHINSTHRYEPFLYHDQLAELLAGTSPDVPYYHEVHCLAQAVRHFFGIPSPLIPESSLIQEFIK